MKNVFPEFGTKGMNGGQGHPRGNGTLVPRGQLERRRRRDAGEDSRGRPGGVRGSRPEVAVA